YRGGMMGRTLTCPCPLLIWSEEDLDFYIQAVNTPGSWAALSNMRAYVREAHTLPKEARTPVQNSALVKWKTPEWVPMDSRPAAKQVDPTVVNTPRLTDPPEEWARGLWRYPREAMTRPGVRRTPQGINLSSGRGMLMTAGHAPWGNGIIH